MSPKARQALAIAAFGRGKHHERGWRLSLLPLRRDAVRAESWLRSCWAMARAGGAVSVANGERIRLWGRWMGLPAERLEQLAAEFEGVEEIASQVAENITDWATGARPDLNPMEGAFESFVYGAGGGAQFSAMSLPAYGAKLANKAKTGYEFRRCSEMFGL